MQLDYAAILLNDSVARGLLLISFTLTTRKNEQ